MTGISLQVIRHDGYTMQLWISATNDRFSGEAIVTTVEKELSTFTNHLKGFPKYVNDIERAEIGDPQPNYSEEEGGYLGLAFYCTDNYGHPEVFVTIAEGISLGKSNPLSEEFEIRGKVQFKIRFDPAQLDRFVEELTELGKSKQGTATFEGLR